MTEVVAHFRIKMKSNEKKGDASWLQQAGDAAHQRIRHISRIIGMWKLQGRAVSICSVRSPNRAAIGSASCHEFLGHLCHQRLGRQHQRVPAKAQQPSLEFR